MKQCHEKYTFRPGKTYKSQGLVGAREHFWALLGSCLAMMVTIFDIIVSKSTSLRRLSRLKPLLDPPF